MSLIDSRRKPCERQVLALMPLWFTRGRLRLTLFGLLPADARQATARPAIVGCRPPGRRPHHRRPAVRPPTRAAPRE
jgi:hypothetical protein